MKESHEPRLFADNEAVAHIGEGLLACTLTRSEWTHEAHLAACAWIIVARPDILPERDLPTIIRRFNESVGGINDETQGYHETITQCSIRGVRAYLARTGRDGPPVDLVNGLLRAKEGRRGWPLGFYSPALLFSVPARMGFIPPDLRPLPDIG